MHGKKDGKIPNVVEMLCAVLSLLHYLCDFISDQALFGFQTPVSKWSSPGLQDKRHVLLFFAVESLPALEYEHYTSESFCW